MRLRKGLVPVDRYCRDVEESWLSGTFAGHLSPASSWGSIKIGSGCSKPWPGGVLKSEDGDCTASLRHSSYV